MGGSGPTGPVFQIPATIFADPERRRLLQAEEQKQQLRRLQQEVNQLKSELEQQPKIDQSKNLIDALVQITSTTFDKAMAYTNLIIVAGYGAFFALWTITKNDLAPLPATLAAILILISVATFVFFEIYRMACTALTIRSLNGLLENPDGELSVAVMQERMNEFNTRSRTLNLSFTRIWEIVLFVTVGTGVFGVFILFGALLYRLVTLLGKVI